MNIVRYPQFPTHALQNEIKHVFDRFFEQNGDTDESAVVTAQWVPRVDIKEEPNHFVLYADLPGIDPSQIEVQMDKGILSIKGSARANPAPKPSASRALNAAMAASIAASRCPTAPTPMASRLQVITACWKSAFPSARPPRRAVSRLATVRTSAAAPCSKRKKRRGGALCRRAVFAWPACTVRAGWPGDRQFRRAPLPAGTGRRRTPDLGRGHSFALRRQSRRRIGAVARPAANRLANSSMA